MADTNLAVEANGNGLSDLRLVRRPAPPPPGHDQICVEMLAMTINPADLLMLEGRYGTRPAAPFVPGTEGVGRVVAVGPGAEIPLGTLVVPLPMGTWIERLTVKARHVVPLPVGVDLEQAAMLKANPATALAMLTDVVELERGTWLVQNAANSAVGQNIVRIGRELGLKVACLVRREAAAAVLYELGADAIIVDDGQGPVPRLPGNAKAALGFDAVGGTATERLGACVADNGTVVTYGLLSGEAPRLAAHDVVFRGLTLRGFWLARWFETASPGRVKELYETLADWLQRGVIGARVGSRFRLEEIGDAVVAAAREGRAGKVLIRTDLPARY